MIGLSWAGICYYGLALRCQCPSRPSAPPSWLLDPRKNNVARLHAAMRRSALQLHAVNFNQNLFSE